MAEEKLPYDCEFLAKKFSKEFLALINETNKTNKEVTVPFCKPWTDLEGRHMRLGEKDVGTSTRNKPKGRCREDEEYMGNFHTHPASTAYGSAIPSVLDLYAFNLMARDYGIRGPFCIGSSDGKMSCGTFLKLDPSDYDKYTEIQKNFEKCQKSKSPEQIKSQCLKVFEENAKPILKKYPYCEVKLSNTEK